MAEQNKSGHRQRLRDRFIAGEASSRTDDVLVELLLTYAIPLRDVQPLAKQLVTRFGGLAGVLDASFEDLCKVSGIKENSAVLIKLAGAFRKVTNARSASTPPPAREPASTTLEAKPPSTLFDPTPAKAKPQPTPPVPPAGKKRLFRPVSVRKGTDLFSIPALEEAIALLPKLPDTTDLEAIKEFLRSNLHYSSAKTRQGYAAYIVKRMFPTGIIDRDMVRFARVFQGQQELRDACFYRFCKAEALMQDMMLEVVIPAAGAGKLRRERFRTFLEARFGRDNKNIKYCSKAAPQALAGAKIANVDRQAVSVSFRDIKLASFAFVLHSEFPEPAMYDVAKAESNRLIRAMLWNPSQIVPSLYELRNRGIISKVSEIDNLRQFTTKWTLGQVVDQLAAKGDKG
jgi:DNA repair protein RadC